MIKKISYCVNGPFHKYMYIVPIFFSRCVTVCTFVYVHVWLLYNVNLSQELLQHGADPNLQTDIKPRLAPPPASLPPAEEGLVSNMSMATSSVTKLDDFAEATDQIGGGMISPTALGALSALSSVTAQVRESSIIYYSLETCTCSTCIYTHT